MPTDGLRRRLAIQEVEGGFPHSEILGSKLVRSSPRLIAAYHVLHRLSVPRHPPIALISLHHSHDRCPRTRPRPGHVIIRKTIGFGSISRPKHSCRTPRTPAAVKRLAVFAGYLLSRSPTIGSVPSSRYERSHARRKRRAANPLTWTLRMWSHQKWWSQTGSNRRPHACKARALPTELWPRRDGTTDKHGGPGTTRTSDLTLIRGAL